VAADAAAAAPGTTVIAELGFFGALTVIGWVYAGYPLVLSVVARLRPRPVLRAPIEPRVTVIIAAYNEEDVIRRKLEDTLACDYPADRLEVIVASDASSDRTDDIVRGFAPRVRLLRVEGRLGKTIAQNRAVEIASGEIVIFSDASTVYAPDTIRRLVENFADPTVGCVSGNVIYERDPRNPSAQGRALFWDYERSLRQWETQVHSIIGAAGCAYALRRSLYVPLERDASSDFVEPGKITERGYRTVEDTRAVVYEAMESGSLGSELRRRTRVAAMGLAGAFKLKQLLNPLRHPWFALELWSHRVLRWLLPLFMLVLLGASIALAREGLLYRLALVGQVSVYASGALAVVLAWLRVRPRALYVPLYFCLLNLAGLLAIAQLARGERVIVWETGR
jgi:glycosyltransferase involved in cell wall biosynthesis